MKRNIFLSMWEKRRKEIYDYEQNHSYMETAQKFGISLTRVYEIKKQVEYAQKSASER